ncbi:sporulation protein [Blastococcus sp. MG754426]|uniref:hypothetical protein n=1 Tax=unclassified Blastococcus TaxID=2619396 RepID=UPI001EEFA2BD|nr:MULTISPECIES: hypothetical protein [unclassified Blastococcus]MCF6507276.1 sporulation protein [Blastococcus sp. MG754426]MCF6510762.1 sporulation protein [Blastococcus sp. MG754427]
MRVEELLGQARDAVTVRRVFGEPYEKDGVTVIPAARIGGGGGGGSGFDQAGQENSGGGFGVGGRPAGAFVVRDGRVSWQPAVDPNRVIAVAGALLGIWLLTRSRPARAHRGG